MPMPEAAVHQNDNAVTWKHDVGPSRKVLSVEGVAQSGSMQKAPDGELGNGVLATDPGHHLAARRAIYDVSHVSRTRRTPVKAARA